MQEHTTTSIDHQEQDKIRIKSGDHKGEKGFIQAITSDQLVLQLESGMILYIDPKDVTNQSLAARKAWRTMRTQKNI